MMNSYLETKYVDLPWVKELPSHWDVKRGKYLIDKADSKNVGEDWKSTQLLSLTQKGVIKKDINDNKGKTHSDYSTYQIVNKGDFVFCLFDMDETPRTVGLSCHSGMITSAYSTFRPKDHSCAEYYYYFFEWLDDFKGLKPFYTGLRKTVRPPEFLNIKIIEPPLTEQISISAFLRSETTRIDALVAEKQNFITLLKEKRQALISHVVTKGLDPSVPMKDSGVEWIGEVPAHWSIQRLKTIGQSIIGLTYSPDDVEDSGTIVLRSTNIQDGEISLHDNVYVGKDISEKLTTRIGDILICSRNGSRKLIGKNALIDERSAGLSFGAFTTVFRSKMNSFVHLLLNSTLFEYQSGMFLTTTVNQLTTGMLNNFKVPVPPIDEQHRIVVSVWERANKINALIHETKTSIDLLKERRTALISAAVTGKIDVRGLVNDKEGAA